MIHELEKEGHIALYVNFDAGLATIKPESERGRPRTAELKWSKDNRFHG